MSRKILSVFYLSLLGTLMLLNPIGRVSAAETSELVVGLSGGIAFPFGWFAENELTSNVSLTGHVGYMPDWSMPGLMPRVTVSYQEFNGTRHSDSKKDFKDVSLYLQVLYHHDLGMPFRTYIMAGLGVDAMTIVHDQTGLEAVHEEKSGLGVGGMIGAGVTVKVRDYFGIFCEADLKSATWSEGPDFNDIIIRALLGTNFYFF